MKLYYSRNYNPRLAVATARHLRAEVDFEFAAPLEPSEQARFRPLNPNLRLPILVEGETSLWEADAIACRLAQKLGSDFWPTGALLPELIRWLSWGAGSFVMACDKIHFERVTRQRYSLGPVRAELVAEGEELLAESAEILEQHLAGRDWLLGETLTYADFRMACVLPYANLAGISLDPYPRLTEWNRRLLAIPAWRDPFSGLNAPDLPAIPAGVA